MRTLIITTLLLTGSLWAQSDKPINPPDEFRRVKSITWNLDTHRLEWTVQFGTCKKESEPGQCKHENVTVTGELSFSIDPDNATMTDGKETRQFDMRESIGVHRLLDLLEKYGDESYLWWRNNEGKPRSDAVIAKRPVSPYAFMFRRR